MRVLAGDVGGTSTRLAVYRVLGRAEGGSGGGEESRRLERVAESRYASRDHGSLSEILADFLAGSSGARRCQSACLGVAGPVRSGAARLTNLPWVVDSASLAERTGIPTVRLLNDVEAAAWGIEVLDDEGMVELAAGDAAATGNRALLALGTGLGEAGLLWDGARYRPFATEGGHADFAPSDELELELLDRLRRRHGHVSWERVVSGNGLVELHRFLAARLGVTAEGSVAGSESDAAAAIVEAARAGRDPICREALRRFIRLCGAEAGNLVLKLGATGGLYLGGGMAPKLRPELGSPEFLEAFRDKGRMRPLLEAVPVRLILDDRVALLGAARRAARID